MVEQWRPVVGYEGHYEVSDDGRVRSIDRLVKNKEWTRYEPGKFMTPMIGHLGHQRVRLRFEGRREFRLVHRLVLEAFAGPAPDGALALHRNGDPSDNRLANLRWGTYSDNQHDSVRHGTHIHARKTHCKHGHEFTSENTRHFITPKGGPARECRACRRERSRRRAQFRNHHEAAQS